MSIPSGIRGLRRDRLPVLGRVRLGTKQRAQNGNEYPVASDHFVIDHEPAGVRLMEMVGEQPTRIPIVFPVDDLAVVARHNLELWGNGVLRCKGDGDRASAKVVADVYRPYLQALHAAKAAGEHPHAPPADLWASGKAMRDAADKIIPCGGDGSYPDRSRCPMYGARNEGGGGCTPAMHLSFAVEGYPGFGVWRLTTNSIVGIERVLGFLTLLQGATGGRIAGVPLTLTLDPMQMRGREHYVIGLRARDDALDLGALAPGEDVTPDGEIVEIAQYRDEPDAPEDED